MKQIYTWMHTCHTHVTHAYIRTYAYNYINTCFFVLSTLLESDYAALIVRFLVNVELNTIRRGVSSFCFTYWPGFA